MPAKCFSHIRNETQWKNSKEKEPAAYIKRVFEAGIGVGLLEFREKFKNR